MNSTLDFAAAYGSYNGEKRSLLDSEAQNSLNEQLDKANSKTNDKLQEMGKPISCHLDFSALGNLKFDYFDVQASPINYKLFVKLRRIGDEIRTINDTFIDLIEEFKCCNTAEQYNDKVVDGIFRWIVEDFLGSLVDTVEGIIKSGHAIKIILCAVRPVPGNPWIGAGGYDWMNTLYSIVNGFDAIVDWILDGNPLDAFLKPLVSFRKKLKSCTKASALFEDQDPTAISDGMLKKLIDNYESTETTPTDNQKIAYEDATTELGQKSDKRTALIREISQLQRDRRSKSAYADESVSADVETELLIIDSEIVDKTTELDTLTLEVKKAQDTYDVASKPIEKAQETNLQQRYTSDALVRKNLDQIILDKYEPSCTCLAGFLGLTMNQPFEFVTVSTFKDIDSLLSKRVHTSDKDAWVDIVDMAEDGGLDSNIDATTIKDLYINKDNIEKKYMTNNSSIDRDNIKNLKLWSDALFNHDYNSVVLNYTYTNHNGAYITKEYDQATDSLLLFVDKEPTDTLISLYSDDTDQSGTALNKEVFEKNDSRLRERFRVARERSIIIQRRNKVEDQLNQIWNTLRRNALQQLKYHRYYAATADDSFVDSIILKTFNVAANSYDYLYAQATLDRLGSSFDVVYFLQNFTSATNAEINELTDPVGASFDVNFIPEELYQVYDETDDNRPFIGNFQTLQSLWVEFDESIGILDSAINKLDILTEMNNVVIQVVGTALTECGCDLLCKLIQWVVDLIISTAKGLIKLIITKLVQAIMNEHVSYIIKMVIDKYKCYLDGAAFNDNMDALEERSNALKLMFDTGTIDNPGKSPLNYMGAAAYCKVDADAKTKAASALDDDTVRLPLDEQELQDDGTTLSKPQPAFGVDDGPAEPGNRIINYGGVVKEAKTERNIPEIFLDCSVLKPSVEVVLEYRDSYEFMVAFKPSDYILFADIHSISQSQEAAKIVVSNPDGKVIDDTEAKAAVDDISKIMNNIKTQLASTLDEPLYIKPDCDGITEDKENLLTLCSLDNLLINEFKIIDNDVVVSDALLYGELSSQLIYYDGSDEVYENFYDSEPRLLKSTEKYFTYTIPEDVEVISDPIISSQTRDAVDGEDHTPRTVTSTEVSSTVNETISVYTSIDYTYEDVDGVLKETAVTTKTTTVNTQFRYPNLEFLVEFKNAVNRLQVRVTLDVLADRTFELPTDYDVGSYNGKYLNVADLGAVNASNGILVISAEKIYEVCKNLLTESFMLKAPEEVITDINKDPVDTCLLGEAEKVTVLKTQGLVDSTTVVVDKFSESLEDVISDLKLPDPAISQADNPVSIPDMKYSIPFIVLNKEENLLIQIVERKIYLQFPSSSMVNAEPIIIDYELVPDDIYMFSFKFSGLLFNMSLITPDKKVISTKGINIDGYKLFPTILGGSVDKTSSFCGTFYDIIMSKSGNYMLEHNKKSLLSYVPRTSSILFDFGLFKDGRVLNTIGKIGDRFTNSVDGVLDKFASPIKPAEQQANAIGNVVIKKGFYQVFNGYMDSFFCKDNLIGKDFTVSLWLYSLKNTKTKHVIISDDINDIYVYYNAFDKKLVFDIQGVENFVYITLDYWTHITFKHVLYSNSYQLIIHKISNLATNVLEERFVINVISNVQFALMGIFAEYNKEDRRYDNIFDGLLSTISIFFNPIDDATYNELHFNQQRLVRGMEDVERISYVY